MTKQEIEKELLKYRRTLEVMRLFGRPHNGLSPGEVLAKINELEKLLEQLE